MKVDGIKLLKSENTILIQCSSDKFVRLSELNSLKKSFMKTFKELKNIDFKKYQVKMEMNIIGIDDPIQAFKENYQAFYEYICDEAPMAKGFLDRSEFEINGPTVFIKLDNIGAMLLKRNCEHLFKSYSKRLFGKELRFSFVGDGETDVQELYKSTQEKSEEIIQSMIRHQNIEAVEDNEAEERPKIKDNVLIGKAITDEIIPMIDMREDMGTIAGEGEVFSLEKRELKSGKLLYIFNVTDYTFSYTCKCFATKKQDLILSEYLDKGVYIKFRGNITFDTFAMEQNFMVRDINLSSKKKTYDMAEKKRVELHLHSKMSAMDAVTEIGDYIKRAVQWGHDAIALTDHGVLQSFPMAFKAVEDINKKREKPFKMIYGVEGYIENFNYVKGKGRRNFHISILCKNEVGIKNLYKLVSFACIENFKTVPRFTKEKINELREGLIIGAACEAGEFFDAITNGKSDEELLEIAKFYDYLEVQPIGNNMFMLRDGKVSSVEELQCFNKKVIEIGEALDKIVVATGDVHFLDERDSIYRAIIMNSKGYDDAVDQAPLYFRTTEQMLKEFDYLDPEKAYELVVTNTNKIADMVDFTRPIPKGTYPPKMEGADDDIRRLSEEKAHQLYGDVLPEIIEQRMEKELNSIIKNGFAVMYMIAQKLVQKSLQDGYLVGSRGSVGSSFVAYLSGITEVNSVQPHYRCECKYSEFITDGSYECGFDLPDKVCPNCGRLLIKDGYDIPFETFLGFDGDKEPDIDLNFSSEYQATAHKYTEVLFGEGYVFKAGTIGKVAEKTAIGYVKKYAEEHGIPLNNAEMLRLAKGCEEVKRTTSQHPGGIMVVPDYKEVFDFTPIQRPADVVDTDIITTHFDYNFLHGSILKLDILGHVDPTVIKMLEGLTGVDAKTIEIGERKTMSLFSSTEALGVAPEDIDSQVGTYAIPEFGTPFVRNMLVDTRPQYFSELIRISGLSHGTDVWLGNAKTLIDEGTCTLKDAICCRDDIMLYLHYNGLPPKTAFFIMERVRKGKGLTEEDEALMRENSIPEWYIDSCKKIKYMFPKAHAAAYVMMAFRIAWFKVYHPLAFYSTIFSLRADDFDAAIMCKGLEIAREEMKKIKDKGNEASAKEQNMAGILEIVIEMYARGFEFLPITLFDSHGKNFIPEDGKIRPPLNAIAGVAENAAMQIKKNCDEEFLSIEDFSQRTGANKSVVEALKNYGCLDGIPETTQYTLF